MNPLVNDRQLRCNTRDRRRDNDALGPGTYPASRLSPASLGVAKATCFVLENIPLVLAASEVGPNCYPGRPG